jgi:hypothetical protein
MISNEKVRRAIGAMSGIVCRTRNSPNVERGKFMEKIFVRTSTLATFVLVVTWISNVCNGPIASDENQTLMIRGGAFGSAGGAAGWIGRTPPTRMFEYRSCGEQPAMTLLIAEINATAKRGFKRITGKILRPIVENPFSVALR